MANLPLEKLINSLSQGELRAFSLSIKKEANPSYYELFNSIRTGKYDKKKKDNNETQRRNYLYNAILDSLLGQAKTIDTQIAKGLHQAELLYNRHLEKEAWKVISKAEKLANKHERFGYIIQILEWKKIIGFRLGSFSTQDYRDTSAQEKETIDKYLNYLKAAGSYHELLIRKKKEGYVQELDKLPDTFNLDESLENSNLPKRTLYYQRMATAIKLCLVQDVKAQYKITKLIMQDAAVIIEPNECMLAYFEHLTSCICIGEFEELLFTLKKLKTDIKKGRFGNNQDITLKLFYYSSNYETMAYNYSGDRNQLVLKVKEVEQGINKLGTHLSKEMNLVIFSALLIAYYFLGEAEKSKNYINKILTTDQSNLRKDVFQETLFFYLLICIDENNDEELLASLKKIDSNYDLNRPQYKFEQELFPIFQSYSNGEIDKLDLYTKVIRAYENIDQELSSGFKYTENLYPFFLWAYSRKNNTDILTNAKYINQKYFKNNI